MKILRGVERRRVVPYGNALVATRPFEPGDIVIQDQPVLATTECSELLNLVYDAHDNLGIRADLLGKDASIDFTLQMLQYSAASEAVKADVLRLYTPDLQQFRRAPYVLAAQQYAQQLFAAAIERPDVMARSPLAPVVASCAPDEVIRVVLAWVCNCYSTCDGGGALYEYGSLVNHCCEGNTRYRFLQDDDTGSNNGIFVAVRQIQPGDVITACYLGWDEQTLMSTRMRKKLLAKTKLFNCTCERCSRRRDPYRQVPCPHCQAAAGAGGRGGDGVGQKSIDAMDGGHHTVTGVSESHAGGNGEGFAGNGDPGGVSSEHSDGSSGGFLCWNDDADQGAGDANGGGENGGSHGNLSHVDGLQRPWECNTCGQRFTEDEVRQELRRRTVAAGRLGRMAAAVAAPKPSMHTVTERQNGCDEGGRVEVRSGPADGSCAGDEEGTGGREGAVVGGAAAAMGCEEDPEAALEEEVHAVGEQLDWSDVAVSLGTVRCLGARCQAVLGDRHWTTNRCRYTILELCTAALTRTCAASRTAGSVYSAWAPSARHRGGLGRGSSTAGGGGVECSEGGAGSTAGGGGGGGGDDSVGCVRGSAGVAAAAAVCAVAHAGSVKAASGAQGEALAGDADLATAAAPLAPAVGASSPQSAPAPPVAEDESGKAGGSVSPTHENTAAAPMECPAPGQTALGETIKGTRVDSSAPVADGTPAGGVNTGAGHVLAGGGEGRREMEPAPHVNPHLGRETLRQHTLHHERLQVRQQQLRQQLQQLHVQTHQLSDLQQRQQYQQDVQLPSPPKASGALEAADASAPTAASAAAAADTTAIPIPADTGPVASSAIVTRSGSGLAAPLTPPKDASCTAPTPASTTSVIPAAAPSAAVAAVTPAASDPTPSAAAPVSLTGRGGPGGAGPGLGPGSAAATAATAGGTTAAAVVAAWTVAGSAGGSTLWSLVEVDALVGCICEELQALWQWQQHHTPDQPEVVLKAVAGPAATALMEVVKDELCSNGPLSARALATAEATAARLAATYASAPHYDVTGTAHAEAVSVLQLCPLIRLALDIP